MHSPKTCKGFAAVFTCDDQSVEPMEICYALLQNGKILESSLQIISTAFLGRSWKESSLTIQQVRAIAQYIGTYPEPLTSKVGAIYSC